MKNGIVDTVHKNLTERTFSGFFWMMLGSGFQVALKIGVLAVLARMVTPREFGVMGIAVMVIEFSKMFTHMGVGPAIIQKEKLEPRHLVTGFSISIGIGLFFALLLVGISPLLSLFFHMPELTDVLRVVALVFFIDSLTLIAQALMQRNMRFRIGVTLEVASYAFGYGLVSIVLANFGWGIWALVAGNLSQALLFMILVVMVQPFPKKVGFEKNAFKELIYFGGGMTLAKIGNFLANQGDNIVVARMLGASSVGLYGRAYQFMVMPAALFGNALDRALFPAMAKVQNNKPKLAKAYLTGVSVIALIAIPVSLIFVFVSREIVMVLLGHKWTGVVLPLQILSLGLLFRMSYKMSDSLARATGAVYKRAWRQVVYAGAVIAGAYLGQFWGLGGVAVGVAIALVINFTLMAQLSFQLTSLTWAGFLNAHKYGVVSGSITGVVGYGLVNLCRNSSLPDYITLIVTALGSCIPVGIALFYFPRIIISEDLRDLFELLVTKRFKILFAKHG